MRRLNKVGLCALVVMALGAAYATTASAALPEVGRCLKVTSGGKYKTATCTTAATETEDHWEWYPPPANSSFEGNTGFGDAGLETLGGTKIYCTSPYIEGKWTGPRTALIEIAFYPCDLQTHPPTEGGPMCMIDGLGSVVHKAIWEEEMIRTVQPVEAELGFINKEGATPTVGFKIKSRPSPEPPIFTFFCGGPLAPEMRVPQAWKIEGNIIGEVKPVDKMAEAHELAFEKENGRQVVQNFEGAGKDTPTATITSTEGSRSEEVGMRMHVSGTSEPLEVKAK